VHPNLDMPRRAEVVVIGGGPAGAVAALTLARSGVMVVLLDAGVKRYPPVGETLPPAIRPALDRLGLRTAMSAEGHLPSAGSWSAWGGAEPWGHDQIFNRFGHGWHIDRRRFDALLREAARSAGARVVIGASVVSSDRLAGGGFRICLEDGAEITASIVIDASGRSACFARQRNVKRRALDRMVALVGYVVRRGDAEAEPAATLVEATAEGWWYSAPLPQDRLVTIFMTDADLARGIGVSTESWLERLSSATHTGARALRYGAGLAGPPLVVPASSSRLERFGDADWLAIGFGSVWVTVAKNNEVVRVDPVRNVVQARVAVDKEPCYGIGIGVDRVWVLNCQGKTLTRINPKTNAVDMRVPVNIDDSGEG